MLFRSGVFGELAQKSKGRGKGNLANRLRLFRTEAQEKSTAGIRPVRRGNRKRFPVGNKRMTKKITGILPRKQGKKQKNLPRCKARNKTEQTEKSLKIHKFCGKRKNQEKIIAETSRTEGRKIAAYFLAGKEKGCNSVSNRLQ